MDLGPTVYVVFEDPAKVTGQAGPVRTQPAKRGRSGSDPDDGGPTP
jgi:hypothetical protein